ncbi:MAG: PAS domain S-box protein [Anaeromyxobacter sp.]|nr:PAS domain S-box protein [Anaeromyxobacter sp.]
MDRPVQQPADDLPEAEIAERLHWLLRLRWLIVPVFVAVDLANDLLTHRRAPWTSLYIGAVLLLANAVYAWLLARKVDLRAMVRWTRFESALVVAVPVVVMVLHGEPDSAVRYGVLVGVVGAAVVLPRTGEVAVVGMWAVAALMVADAVGMGFDPARIDQRVVARWAWDTGIIVTVALIAGYLHSSRDWASQRLRTASEGLERARAEWEATFDSINELVFVTDREGRVLRVNRAFAKVLGARPHELAGRRVSDLLAGHPDRWWTLPGDGIVEIEDPVFDTLFEVTSTRLGDRVVQVARDVGEQRRLYARLVQADKLAAVGVLASGVAHEINNPTAFVTSNLTELRRYVATFEAALGEGPEPGEAAQAGASPGRLLAGTARGELAFARREAQKAITESLTGMERIRQIVNNLRSLARRDQAGEPAALVELGELVQLVVRTAASDLKHASARVDLQGPVWVSGHRGELVDVLLNLVVNAVQAREPGRPNRISIELLRDGPQAVVQVADTGKGIAQAHMKRLFEPFFTTKAPGEGTGLGLNLARKIVLSHGGAIEVASELGVGSTFTVRLPAVDLDTRGRLGDDEEEPELLGVSVGGLPLDS